MQDRNILSKDDILRLLGEINSKLAKDNRDGLQSKSSKAQTTIKYNEKDNKQREIYEGGTHYGKFQNSNIEQRTRNGFSQRFYKSLQMV